MPAQRTSRKRTRAAHSTTSSSNTSKTRKRQKLDHVSPRPPPGADAYDIPDSDEAENEATAGSQRGIGLLANGERPIKATGAPHHWRGGSQKASHQARAQPPEVEKFTASNKLPDYELGHANNAISSKVDTPKGILSPTKGSGRVRPRKSVVFDDHDAANHTGSPTPKKRGRPPKSAAKSIAQPPSLPRPRARGSLQVTPNDPNIDVQDDDDKPCSVCGVRETTKNNDILFCDRCDTAVHQKCYGIKKVPKGDWFCRECSSEDAPNSGSALPAPNPKTVGNRTAPNKTSANIQDGRTAEENETEESDVESIPCGICGNPDTAPDDDIIFCDNCDFAVHQKCYNVLTIPEGDWLCRRCAKKETPTGAEDVQEEETAEPAPASSSAIPDIPNFEQHIRAYQRVLLDRCSGRRRIKLRGQDDSYKKAYNLVERTVLAGEGNSMLIIGARGCGKTTLVESVISSLRDKHPDDFHVVRLSGFIHTDDKLALRDIWRQLAKERGLDAAEANKRNYADTMASLLGLLSSSEEITGEETEEGTAATSVVFVIDEFDLFATHARQTLLYNLFDIAQAKKAPIAVLGLTARIEVVELLEKRVKSRFSHRSILLSMPRSLPMFWDICKQGLVIEEDCLVAEGINTQLEGHAKFLQYWNKKIEHLRKSEEFDDHLKTFYYSSKSVASFLHTCILPLSKLSAVNPTLSIPGDDQVATSLEPPDSKLHLLGSLADLDLALLISASRLDIVADTDTVNFAMAYDEYTRLMAKQRVATASQGIMALGAGAARVWGRNLAAAAWERLAALGLLVPSAIGGGGVRRPVAGSLDNRMWKIDTALEEVPGAAELGGMLAKWCKEI